LHQSNTESQTDGQTERDTHRHAHTHTQTHKHIQNSRSTPSPCLEKKSQNRRIADFPPPNFLSFSIFCMQRNFACKDREAQDPSNPPLHTHAQYQTTTAISLLLQYRILIFVYTQQNTHRVRCTHAHSTKHTQSALYD
jgi:hypothetical protein